MATNKSSQPFQNKTNLSGLLHADWKWLHPIEIILTHYALCNFTPNGVGHFSELAGAHI